MNYLESLKKGNQTLTEKVSRLECQVLEKQRENTELMKENFMLKSTIRSLEAKIKSLEKRSLPKPTSLEEAIRISCNDIISHITKGR